MKSCPSKTGSLSRLILWSGELAIFSIRTFGDPVLRKPGERVGVIDAGVRKLMRDMRETMEAAPGVGLAAPQIGVSKRVIVWAFEEDSGTLADPAIVDHAGSVEGDEACLSLPGLVYPVTRAEWVRVEGLDEEGQEVALERSGWVARILQHEVDHTEGVLFIDRLSQDLQKEAKRMLREQALGAPLPAPADHTL